MKSSVADIWTEPGTDLGCIALRHELNDFLANVGERIGHSVRPSARRRGLVKGALKQTLNIARDRGLERVLITCREDKRGSRRTIESSGGVYEDSRTAPYGDEIRRYCIPLR